MASLSKEKKVFHVCNRLTFGISLIDIAEIKKIGIDEYIKKQLNPQNISQIPFTNSQINQQKKLNMTVSEIFKNYHLPYLNYQENKKKYLSKEQAKELNQQRQFFLKSALEFKILNSINNPKQLEEIMTDFWFNHFNIFVNKEPNIQRFLINNYEQKAIKPHSLGKFRDLLQAVAQHPSMMYYLDNVKNVASNLKTKKSSKSLNENYARELMELHTLGVDGGYTQEDVMNLARILTGWGIINPKTPQTENGFYFHEKRHDYGDKKFLGHTIKGSGIEEVYQALDILANHPSTANYISYKLAQFFVADTPPNSLVKKLAKTFLDTQGNIKLVLNQLFISEEFWDSNYYQNKFKTPYQYIISVLRIASIQNLPINPLIETLKQLQMSPYYCITPDGYKNTQEAWLSADSMIKRINFVTNIQEIKVNSNNKNNANQLLEILDNFLSMKTKDNINKAESKWQLSLILGSPEMMYK